MSIGLAVFPDDAASFKLLFEAADHRNFLAKRKGRACVVSDGATTASDHPIQEPSRLIERDESLLRMQAFLDDMNRCARGVFRVAGAVGAGRSRFLSDTITAAKMRKYLGGAPLRLPPRQASTLRRLAAGRSPGNPPPRRRRGSRRTRV